MNQTTFALKPIPPYDFRLAATYATYFRGIYGAESYRDGVFRRLLDIEDALCLASVHSVGTKSCPLLQVEITGMKLDDINITKARQQISWILGTEQDLLSFYRMVQNDRVLSPLVVQLEGLHIPQTASVYEALVLAIVGQQINSQVAGIPRTLLINTYGPKIEIAGHTYHSFPQVSDITAVSIDGLRVVKLSNRKAQYIADISNRIMSGELELESLYLYSVEEVVSKLTDIRGVGSWTAHWLLIRTLGRIDGFPYEDLALCRALSHLLGLSGTMTLKETLEYSQHWSPFWSYGITYLFAAIRSGLI